MSDQEIPEGQQAFESTHHQTPAGVYEATNSPTDGRRKLVLGMLKHDRRLQFFAKRKLAVPALNESLLAQSFAPNRVQTVRQLTDILSHYVAMEPIGNKLAESLLASPPTTQADEQ